MEGGQRELQKKQRPFIAGGNKGSGKTSLFGELPILLATQTAREEIETGFAALVAEFASASNNEKTSKTMEAGFICLRQLADLLGLLAGGKEEGRVIIASQTLLGSIKKVFQIFLGLHAELETAQASQKETTALKGANFEEILQVYLERFKKELAELRQILDQEYRLPEEQARDKLVELAAEIEENERELMAAEGELEAIAAAVKKVDIAALAASVQADRPDLDAAGQMAEMQKRLQAELANNSKVAEQEAAVKKLREQKTEFEAAYADLEKNIADMEQERVAVERRDILPLQDRIAGIERIINPATMLVETASQPSSATTKNSLRDETAAQMTLPTDALQAAKAVMVVLDIITSPPYTSSRRTSEVLHAICVDVGLVPKDHSLPEFESSMQQLRGLESPSTNFGVQSPPQGMVVYMMTTGGRRLAKEWREEINFPAELLPEINSAFDRLIAVRPHVRK